MNTFNREVTVWMMAAFVMAILLLHTVFQHSGRTLPPPAIHHQQDSLLARIVTLDSLIYDLNEKESQKPIVYGKQSNYNRAFFREWDTLHADRRHTQHRLNIVNSRVNNK